MVDDTDNDDMFGLIETVTIITKSGLGGLPVEVEGPGACVCAFVSEMLI